MKILYLFRHPSPVFHSIEEQFFAVQNYLPKSVEFQSVFAKYDSKGLLKRIAISLQFAFNQADVNHITGDIHFVALFLKKRKTILTVHDIGSVLNASGLKNKILRYFWFTMPFARVSKVTVISEFTKREILKTFKINPEKITVVPDCISDAFTYLPKEFNSIRPNILQIGTKDNKNLPRLVDALRGIPCTLTIVGRLTNDQRRMLSDAEIDYQNAFNLPFADIVKLYQRADIVSFVSLYEGFGVPVLEAQATGRALITSNIAPMCDVAGSGAITVSPYEVSEIREALLRIIEDENLRNGIISKGLENVKQYTAQAVANRYIEIYNEIMSTQ